MYINYFQAGGAVPAQAAQSTPSEGQDLQSQVVQLVQAAMQGDEKATQAIQQVMEAAKQGDEQATQIAQLIQAVVQQIQGQARAAKQGAKLSYLHSLKTGCPEGYNAHYYKQGGNLCKECIKKQADGGELSDEDKKMGRGTAEQVKAKVAQLKKKYPQLTEDQLAGRTPIVKNGVKYYMNGDGELIESSKLKQVAKDKEGNPIKRVKQNTPSGYLANRKDMSNREKLTHFNQTHPYEDRKVDLTPAERKTQDSLYVKTKKEETIKKPSNEKGGCLKKKLSAGKKVNKPKCANGGHLIKFAGSGDKAPEVSNDWKLNKIIGIPDNWIQIAQGDVSRSDNIAESEAVGADNPELRAERYQVPDKQKSSYNDHFAALREQEEGLWYGLSLKEAMKEAKRLGRDWFGYKGKVYRTNSVKDSATQKDKGDKAYLTYIYGSNLGWSKELKNLSGTKQGKKAAQYRENTRNTGIVHKGDLDKPDSNVKAANLIPIKKEDGTYYYFSEHVPTEYLHATPWGATGSASTISIFTPGYSDIARKNGLTINKDN